MRTTRAGKPDYILALTVFLLCFFGIVMISSASIVISQEHFGSNYYYVTHQILSLVIGLILMVTAYFIDYRVWRKFSLTMFMASLVLILAVFIPGIGKEFGGAHRWIGIGNVLFQPSEIVKLTFIIYLASWLEKKGEGIRDISTGFLPFIFLIVVLGFLIMSQPDLGTLTVIAGSAVAVFFVAGARISHLGLAGLGTLILLFILIKAAPYRMQRFLVFLNPKIESLGASYHINQALIAVGSGGLWGLGFGQSKQKYLYLPQPHIDSIFAIIAEELGFIFTTIFIVLIISFLWRGFKIARAAPDPFARYLATGILAWLGWQACVNMASMLNILPLTGIPLPFVSAGGTALVTALAAIGILTNISRQTKSFKHL